MCTALWLVCTPRCRQQTAFWPFPRPLPSVQNGVWLCEIIFAGGTLSRHFIRELVMALVSILIPHSSLPSSHHTPIPSLPVHTPFFLPQRKVWKLQGEIGISAIVTNLSPRSLASPCFLGRMRSVLNLTGNLLFLLLLCTPLVYQAGPLWQRWELWKKGRVEWERV